MVHKIAKIKELLSKHTDTAAGNQILFAPEKEISKEELKQYQKKLYSFSTPEGVGYIMRGSIKIPHTKEIALGILDAQDNGYSNVVIEKDKVAIFVRTLSDNSHIHVVEEISRSEVGEDIEIFAENYFQGYGFKLVKETKDLEKLYIKSYANKFRIFALIAMLIMGSAMYLQYIKTHGTKRAKAQRPNLPVVSPVEKNDAKHTISIKFMDKLLKEVEEISLGKSIVKATSNTRISNIMFNPYDIIQPQVPYYDEEDNAWYYSDDTTKRGGVRLAYHITIQKSYPEKLYRHKGDIGDKSIYTKESRGEIEHFFDPEQSRDRKVPISISCLQKAFDIGKIQKRDAGLMQVAINNKNYSNLEMVALLNDTLRQCPAYIDSMSINGNGEVEGNLYFYYKF